MFGLLMLPRLHQKRSAAKQKTPSFATALFRPPLLQPEACLSCSSLYLFSFLSPCSLPQTTPSYAVTAHSLTSSKPHLQRTTDAATMNDPGLDEPLNETQNKIEGVRKEEEDFEQEVEQSFLDPRSNPQCLPTQNPLLTSSSQSMVVCFDSISLARCTYQITSLGLCLAED